MQAEVRELRTGGSNSQLAALSCHRRALDRDHVLAFVVEQDDTDLGAEQPGDLARQQLANLADLGAGAHHQGDVVQPAQPFDLLLQLQGGFVDCVGKLANLGPGD